MRKQSTKYIIHELWVKGAGPKIDENRNRYGKK